MSDILYCDCLQRDGLGPEESNNETTKTGLWVCLVGWRSHIIVKLTKKDEREKGDIVVMCILSILATLPRGKEIQTRVIQ